MANIMSTSRTPKSPEYEHKWQHLVAAMVENGGDVPDAAETAGYGEVQSAYRALREPHVQEALITGLRSRLARLGPAALQTLLMLSQSARSEKVRLDAAVAVLDRLGLAIEATGPSVRIGEVNITMDLGGGVEGKRVPSPRDPHPLPQKDAKPEASAVVIEDAEIITDVDTEGGS